MVHLQSVLGVEATEIVLRGMSDLANLPIAVFLLDPDHRDQLVDYIWPKTATGEPYKSSEFCRYLHRLPGGGMLCRQCDSYWGWRIFDERWTKARRYECHMGLSELGITVEAGGDLVDPIVWGQVRLKGTSIETHIDDLRVRAEQAVRGAAAEITEEHLRELRRLTEGIRSIKKAEADDLCERITSGAQGLERIVQTEYHIARTLHRVKSSLTLSQGAVEEMIADLGPRIRSGSGVASADLRQQCRQVEEGIEDAARAIDVFERSRRMMKGEQRELSRDWRPLNALLQKVARRVRSEAASHAIEVRVLGAQMPESRAPDIARAPGNPHVYIDWENMLELLDLLLDNAVKYSWRGTKERQRLVDVSWRLVSTNPTDLPAKQAPLGKCPWLEVEIENYGLQIHPEDRDVIFQPHGRGRLSDPYRSVRGAGMGLPIALQIAAQHGCYIDVWCKLFENVGDVTQLQDGKLHAPPGRVAFRVGFPTACWERERPYDKETE